MASANWMKATTQKAGALKKHLDQTEREKGKHSNQHIDKELTVNNYTIGCESFNEALSRMKARTKEVDELIPPKRIRKDRVTCCFLELPCPRELTVQGRSDEFFRQSYEVMRNFFGAENVHGGFVHKDEVHEYTDKGGISKTSLEHIHVIVSAYTPEKGINGKAFETKKRLNALNKALDDMCWRSFGVRLNTQETPDHKTVERLKVETELREEETKLRRTVKNHKEQIDELQPQVDRLKAEAQKLELDAEKGLLESKKNYELRRQLLARQLLLEEAEEDAKKKLEKERAAVQAEYAAAKEARYDATDALIAAQNERNYQQRVSEELTEKQNKLEATIEERAEQLAEERIAELFDGIPTSREQRLEQFCKSFTVVNEQTGQSETLHDAFERREKALREDIIEQSRYRGR